MQVDLDIAPDARVGAHALSVITPLGVPPFQSFAVSEFPEVGGSRARRRAGEGTPRDAPRHAGRHDPEVPAIVDHFRFEAHAGQELVFETTAAAARLQFEPALTLLDAAWKGRSIPE